MKGLVWLGAGKLEQNSRKKARRAKITTTNCPTSFSATPIDFRWAGFFFFLYPWRKNKLINPGPTHIPCVIEIKINTIIDYERVNRYYQMDSALEMHSGTPQLNRFSWIPVLSQNIFTALGNGKPANIAGHTHRYKLQNLDIISIAECSQFPGLSKSAVESLRPAGSFGMWSGKVKLWILTIAIASPHVASSKSGKCNTI